jgi:hypothetical protein
VAIVAKETPNAKRLKEEKALDKLSAFGVDSKARNSLTRLRDAVSGGSGYGTSRSPGARFAGDEKSEEIYRKEGKTVGEVMDDKRPRQVMREAAAEERREARGMKKGGTVSASKRADGCAVKGKTKGRMV